MDIASHAEDIYKLMLITNIETPSHTGKSYMEAINSNWGPHITGHQYFAHSSNISSSVTKLGMYTPHNELSSHSSNGLKLYVIILSSHPSQLCTVLSELSQLRDRINNTFLIGSTVPVYEKNDYINCSALNSLQRKELAELAELKERISDKDIMTIYFNELEFNAFFPLISDSQQREPEASFHNNHLMLSFLKSNPHIKHIHSSVIIAAPQPYMPEAVSILRNQMKDATIYRLSSASKFSIYESLNALRSWLQTDHSFQQ